MLLVLPILIIVINSCTNMTQIFCDQGTSNANNFYFDPESLPNSTQDRCGNSKDILKYLNMIDSPIDRGMWGNQSMNCSNGECYTWTFIISPNLPIHNMFKFPCKLDYYVSHNLVAAYKKWDIESAQNLREREIIFGKHFTDAKYYICNCTSSFTPVKLPLSYLIIIIIIAVIIIITSFVCKLVYIHLFKNKSNEYQNINESHTNLTQNYSIPKHDLENVTYQYHGQNEIQLQPIYKSNHQ